MDDVERMCGASAAGQGVTELHSWHGLGVVGKEGIE